MIEVKRQKLKKIINASVISLIILLMLYFLVQLFSGGVKNISTVRVQNITDTSYISMDGYIIRDEKYIYANEGCLTEFLVGNGERVGVNKEYIRYYKTDLAGLALSSAQRELNRYAVRIDILEDSVKGNYTVADTTSIRGDLAYSYSEFLKEIAGGDYSGAQISGEAMLGSINNYNVAIGKEDAVNESLSEVKKQKKEYIEKVSSGNYTSKIADESCFVYMDFDGYEGAFDYSAVMQMTPDELTENIKNATQSVPDGAVGRLIMNSEWFYAVPINATQLKYFEEGGDYDLMFADDGEYTVKMTVEKIYAPERNIGKGLIIFSSRDISIGANLSRYTSVRLSVGETSGYRVPEDAISEIDYDEDGIYDYVGVYVLSGNRVEFRRVEIIGEGVGYVIVKTQERYESDLENKNKKPDTTTDEDETVTEEGESESITETDTETDTETATTTEAATTEAQKDEIFPYLSLGELVILSGGGELYDGKVFN